MQAGVVDVVRVLQYNWHKSKKIESARSFERALLVAAIINYLRWYFPASGCAAGLEFVLPFVVESST